MGTSSVMWTVPGSSLLLSTWKQVSSLLVVPFTPHMHDYLSLLYTWRDVLILVFACYLAHVLLLVIDQISQIPITINTTVELCAVGTCWGSYWGKLCKAFSAALATLAQCCQQTWYCRFLSVCLYLGNLLQNPFKMSTEVMVFNVYRHLHPKKPKKIVGN